jgi:hypothetical protein
VNWLIKWLFQPEASGGTDGATAGDAIEGELSGAEETTKAQTQTDTPLEDAEAIMETEKTEV